MNPSQRKNLVLLSFFILLVVVVLFVFVYAQDPPGLYRPQLPDIGSIIDFITEKFNILNYV
ncbi:MAG: hypothetical protein H8Z69_05125 [Nanohaloarchaea archaeon]|nr:hypothetical protein [Candidatus Nanohaloarchaea archaeon]